MSKTDDEDDWYDVDDEDTEDDEDDEDTEDDEDDEDDEGGDEDVQEDYSGEGSLKTKGKNMLGNIKKSFSETLAKGKVMGKGKPKK